AIAYASYCTSLGLCETFSISCNLFDNLTPLAFRGGLAPRVFIEVLVLVIAEMGSHQADTAPGLELLGADTKPLRHLVERQQPLCTQPLETTLQSIFDRHATDHAPGKWLAIAGHQTAR